MKDNPYQKAYLHLFNEVTDVIEQLKKAQQETEEIFMSADDPEEEEMGEN